MPLNLQLDNSFWQNERNPFKFLFQSHNHERPGLIEKIVQGGRDIFQMKDESNVLLPSSVYSYVKLCCGVAFE